ncbi:family 6 glucosyltransferase [Helicobacter sp. 13S00401-1]|uniref:family 6 glucosyltransferase n=1 Tax=Helicobacter sp. 13S00401-1 TaxID=1905758 RepID=UPI0015535152|nr:family 6 glucosyltransferase [Helicobacter sp. 13S00401-1]
MKIAILYISTGRYDIFFKKFHKTMQKFFIKGAQKHYFVWTDSKKIKNTKDITKIYQEKLGWPYDTLMRYHMFYEIRDRLKEFDYIYFFNANIVIKQEITKDEFLPNTKSGLVGCLHPGFIDLDLEFNIVPKKDAAKFTYDRNEKSLAYIKEGDGLAYYAGGLNGGAKDAYLKLIKDLRDNIQQDLDKGIVALWHDESHINKYFLDKEIKALPSTFLVPEGWEFSISDKFIMDEECMKDELKKKEFTKNLLSRLNLIPSLELEKLLAKQSELKSYEDRRCFMQTAINGYFDLKKHTKILLLEKSNPKYGGHDYLRGEKQHKNVSLRYYISRVNVARKLASLIKRRLKKYIKRNDKI